MTELLNQLREMDEITLLELLEITSEELVDAFLDKIIENKAKLFKYVDE